MPRRSIWSARQRAELFDLPTDEAARLHHYMLSDDDIEHIRVRRRGHTGWASLSSSSSSTGCSTPICSAGPTPARTRARLITRSRTRASHREPGRNPRPLQRGPALPHGRAQPARRHRHLLEYRPFRRSGQTADTRRPDGRARAPGPHLTPWMGPHPAHRRIPVAKTPIAVLAYDSAPYRNRPPLAGTDCLAWAQAPSWWMRRVMGNGYRAERQHVSLGFDNRTQGQ